MKPKNLLLTGLSIVFFSLSLNAQQFTGLNNSTGEINRTGQVGIGLTNSPNDTQLYVQSNNLKVGIVSETFHNIDFQFGILSAVNRPTTKALSVILRNSAGNYEDTFAVSGDGTVNTSSIFAQVDHTQDYQVGISSAVNRVNSKALSVLLKNSSGVYEDKFTVMGDGRVKSSGFFAQVDHTQDYQIGISSAVNRVNSKAFSVLLKNSSGVYEDKFAVMGDGRVLATEVEVRTNIFPDYVFEEDYNLMPLNELESYINKNKHLPNIPAAEKVIEEGIAIGDMQVKQMEKIEELTLYIIELNKKIEELSKEVKKTKN